MLCSLVTDNEPWRHWIARLASTTDYGIRYFGGSITDNGDGTCSWDGAQAAGALAPNASGTVYSRLYRVRMASDAYRVTYLTGKVTEIAAEFVEVWA